MGRVRPTLALVLGAAAWLCLCGASLATRQAVQAGNKALAGGDPAAAAARYQEALAAEPDNPALIYNLGTARLAGGDPAAAGLLRDALERAQGNPQGAPVAGRAAFNLGNALLHQADAAQADPNAGRAALEGAVDAFRKAVAADPDDMDARRNLQLAATRLRDLREQSESAPQDGKRDGKQDAPPRQGDPSDRSDSGQQGQQGAPDQRGERGQGGDQAKDQGGRNQPDQNPRDGDRQGQGKDAADRGGDGRNGDKGEAGQAATAGDPSATPDGTEAGQAMALSAEEVERLLGSLSRGQAATLREAMRRAMGDGGEATVEKDW